MGVLGGFEQRLERAVEGFFARIFRSGVHPVEIGKRLLRVMEDGTVHGLRRVYAPNAYKITLSQADFERLAPLEPKLVEELESFIAEAVRQRGWVLADSARVSFASAPRLSPGEFRIEADPVSVPSGRTPQPASQPSSGQRTAVMDGGGPVLVVMSDDAAVQTLPVRDRIRMGRQADNDLVLPDPGISRHHAEVVRSGSGYVLRDLGSTNGTRVNGATVREHRLSPGDRFVLGQTVIEFRGA